MYHRCGGREKWKKSMENGGLDKWKLAMKNGGTEKTRQALLNGGTQKGINTRIKHGNVVSVKCKNLITQETFRFNTLAECARYIHSIYPNRLYTTINSAISSIHKGTHLSSRYRDFEITFD